MAATLILSPLRQTMSVALALFCFLLLCGGFTGMGASAQTTTAAVVTPLPTSSEFSTRDLVLLDGLQCRSIHIDDSGTTTIVGSAAASSASTASGSSSAATSSSNALFTFDTAPNAFYNSLNYRCTKCRNNSVNAHTAYVAEQMRPINFNILNFMLRQKKVECVCDMSQGYANGNYVSNERVYQSHGDLAMATDPLFTLAQPPVGATTSLVSPICTDCKAFGPFVPSISMDEASGAQGCTACGTVQQTLLQLLSSSAGTAYALADPDGFNGLLDSLRAGNINGTGGIFADAVYDASSPGVCKCPAGTHTVAESIGGVRLPFQVCVLCRSGNVDARDPSLCHDCMFPFVYDATARRCSRCASGYTMMPDGLCELTSRLSIITGMQSGATSTATITAQNWNNEMGTSPAFPSHLLATHLNAAGSRCMGGKNNTACQLLANLCVLSNYDQSAASCMVYRGIQALESCRGEDCEVPTTVPWLYYLRSSTTIFQDEAFVKHVELGEALKFVMSSYSWNGTFMGSEAVVAQLFNCEITSEAALNFFAVGSQRRLDCQINLPYFTVAPDTLFHELFIEADNGELFPVPVLASFTRAQIFPENLGDRSVYRPAARGDLTPDPNAFRRRFYLYDNIGGRAGPNSAKTAYVAYPHSVRVLVEIRPDRDSTIHVPLLILQYATTPTENLYNLLAENAMYMSRARYLRTVDNNDDNRVVSDANELRYTVPGVSSATFSNDSDIVEEALMITLIVMCCVCFVTSWIRTYGWMRRQQNALLGPETLFRWFVYLCNHLSSVFAIIVVITSWILYLFYKNQASVSYMLPVTSKYLFAMLYTATACKGLVVLYRIFEQCNADIFVIDWERSKGQLLRENRTVPVSMWRSTFLANELNEMQILRAWHPLFTMMIVLLFVEGLGYINYARAIPYPSLSSAEWTAPSNTILRIAVAALFWTTITGGLYVLEHYIYYRFIHVHPLRAFVDLCSVSNISLIILLEPMWGFYIHGESIHAHSDVSLVEFQENLKREAQGLMPARGLGGQEQCQTFEVFVGPNLRNYLYCAYGQLLIENTRSLNGEGSGGAPVVAGQHRKCFDFLTGKPGHTRTFTEETLEVKRYINDAFIQSVRSAEKYLMNKFALHQFFDFPPNILFMNGPFANEEMMGKDLYFLDTFWHYGKFMLFGIDHDIFLFYTLLYFCIDTSLFNSYVAMVIIYLVDLCLVQYRAKEGQANMGSKTLFDERFFL